MLLSADVKMSAFPGTMSFIRSLSPMGVRSDELLKNSMTLIKRHYPILGPVSKAVETRGGT